MRARRQHSAISLRLAALEQAEQQRQADAAALWPLPDALLGLWRAGLLRLERTATGGERFCPVGALLRDPRGSGGAAEATDWLVQRGRTVVQLSTRQLAALRAALAAGERPTLPEAAATEWAARTGAAVPVTIAEWADWLEAVRPYAVEAVNR